MHKHQLKASSVVPAFVICMLINAAIVIWPFGVFFIPDLIVLAYIIYKFKDMNQSVSPLFFVGFSLFFAYLLLSSEPADIEFSNKYLVSLKPFIYICILALYSRNVPKFSLYYLAKAVVLFYPVLLIWNIFLYYLTHRPPITRVVQESRPFFMFENNFEITFYISCFIMVAFIYKDKSLRNYFCLSSVILLANSRSGLLTFAVVSAFYFFTLDFKKKIWAIIFAGIAATYVGISRNITQIAGNVDRLQTLNAILTDYDGSLLEILKVPFGYGIYQKVPTYVCAKLPDFAEWFVGNSNNCDPLMLQAFYTRSMFEYGIYITLLIPLVFYWIVKKESGAFLALVIMAPITCVATSVGGFSNGLAFLGVLLSLLAYVQVSENKQLSVSHA